MKIFSQATAFFLVVCAIQVAALPALADIDKRGDIIQGGPGDIMARDPAPYLCGRNMEARSDSHTNLADCF
ncbi:hypothetical protein BDM02DRAFT_841711 [Thelephora ganbajun]|uniref:Uncharacterized protein n=1 Tax=Thelephora ganbajun TaxID=370292 RepID=A0ACB6Z5B8_THEGA|nr:hypothetical protein BDM02DRAFT_841711 [Thelephora ganbajun]